MTKYFWALCAFVVALAASTLIHLSTAHGMSRTRHVPVAVVSPMPSATPEPSPSLMPSADPGKLIQVGTIMGASDDEIEMIHAGEVLANAMLSKPCFKQWVLAASYTENEEMTQAQIFDKVESTPSTINVEIYTGDWHANHISKTVGYENDPFDGVVHMNRYFVDSAYMVADNLIHEDRGHSLGFHHYGVHATSVPYGLNYAFEGCSQQQMQAKGAKTYRPPGLRLEIRHKGKTKKHAAHSK